MNSFSDICDVAHDASAISLNEDRGTNNSAVLAAYTPPLGYGYGYGYGGVHPGGDFTVDGLALSGLAIIPGEAGRVHVVTDLLVGQNLVGGVAQGTIRVFINETGGDVAEMVLETRLPLSADFDSYLNRVMRNSDGINVGTDVVVCVYGVNIRGTVLYYTRNAG